MMILQYSMTRNTYENNLRKTDALVVNMRNLTTMVSKEFKVFWFMKLRCWLSLVVWWRKIDAQHFNVVASYYFPFL